MIGLEFRDEVDSDLAARVKAACQAEGLLLLTTGLNQCFRFIPPLNTTEKEVAFAIDVFSNAVRKCVADSRA
jgi:4-aminobutyrate aminotransferase